MHDLHALQIDPIITRALEEDWGYGDWTTDLCVPQETTATAKLIAKESLLVAGIDVAKAVFLKVNPDLEVLVYKKNGERAEKFELLMEVKGHARSILKGERVALNFFARMCGIANLAREYSDKIQGTNARLLDTRKTTPGLRLLEKSAAVIGGARNHRFGLCDGVIVKENHIRAAGGISQAVSRLMESLPPTIKIEVETSNLKEVEEALEAGVDIIMLDNMNLEQMREAVQLIRGRALVEASGNVRLDNVRDVAETGVNFVSTSAIIQAARAADLSLLFLQDE